jgi:flagellar M-ring protein FliF
MPEQVKKYTDPLKARWDLLTTPQRYKLLGVIVAVLLALILMAYFAFRTPWTVLVSNENFQVTADMQNALNNAGIRNELIDNGTGIQVDTRRRNEARSVITIEGAAPNRDHFTWADALDTSMGTTNEERLLRDLLRTQGALESQLHAMNGITNPRVVLTVPSSRPFERDPDLPSASVTLTVGNDFAASGRDLAMLVARGVTRLTPENIIIMDQNGRSIWNGADDIQNDPAGAAQQAQEHHRNMALTGAIQLLSLPFDEVSGTFIPVFDPTILSEEIRTIYEIPDGMDGTGIAHTDIGSRAEVEGDANPLEPGLQNNTAAFPNYQIPGGGGMSASQRDWHTTFHVNTSTIVTQSGSGGVVPDLSAASFLAINHLNVYQDTWMAQEEGRTQADWDMYKAENTTPILINETFEEFERFHTLAANAVGLPTENVSLIVMQRIIPHDTIVRAWDIPTILMVAVLLLLLAMLLYGLLRKQRTAGEDEEALEPQLAVEDLLVSTQLEEAKEEESQVLEEIDIKENEIKKHIEKFVNEKPEAVAALLRNWINVEEW